MNFYDQDINIDSLSVKDITLEYIEKIFKIDTLKQTQVRYTTFTLLFIDDSLILNGNTINDLICNFANKLEKAKIDIETSYKLKEQYDIVETNFILENVTDYHYNETVVKMVIKYNHIETREEVKKRLQHELRTVVRKCKSAQKAKQKAIKAKHEEQVALDKLLKNANEDSIRKIYENLKNRFE